MVCVILVRSGTLKKKTKKKQKNKESKIMKDDKPHTPDNNGGQPRALSGNALQWVRPAQPNDSRVVHGRVQGPQAGTATASHPSRFSHIALSSSGHVVRRAADAGRHFSLF